MRAHMASAPGPRLRIKAYRADRRGVHGFVFKMQTNMDRAIAPDMLCEFAQAVAI